MSSGMTAPARPVSAPAAQQPARVFRADIQGLRAFAVIAVIVNHMVGWPVGGFVGVDIFFVISGYLITGHLMKEWERTGRISFVQFYRRRIKRILPASTLALVVTVAAGFVLFPAARAWSTFWDGVWALFFVGNWRFAAEGTDYFAADGPVSPLQHYWSLGVEEQFYFVWPWVMLLALVVVARRRPQVSPRLVASLVIGALSVLSFLWALQETVSAPTVAYFSTLSRAWELGIGALLALAAPLIARVREQARPLMAWIGIAGMVLSLFLVAETSSFPAPVALLPVLSCALVIAAGENGGQRHIGLLTNRVAGYIGDISFSLYLWHMPVIILTASLFVADTVAERLVQILLMAALSMVAYHVWEDPIRRSGWLSGPRHGRAPRRAGRAERLRATSSVALVLVAALLTSLTVSAERQQAQAHQEQQAAVLERELRAGSEEGAQAPVPPGMPAVAAVHGEVEQALRLTSWGDAEADLEAAIGDHTRMDETVRACSDGKLERSHCRLGPEDAQTSVMLVGDSIGRAFVPSVRGNLEQLDWRLELRVNPGCSFIPITREFPTAQARQRCVDHRESVLEDIRAEQPDIVLISNSVIATEDEDGTPVTPQMWQEGLQEYLAVIEDHSEAVVITGPPADKTPASCHVRGGVPLDCLGTITDLRQATTQAEQAAAEATGAALADTTPLFCALGRCPAVVDGVPVKIDRTHITVDYAAYLAPAMGDLLAGALETEPTATLD